MHPLRSWLVLTIPLAYLWCSTWTTLSHAQQNSIDGRWVESSSHRYLPPPNGINSISDQVRMLERLSQIVGQKDDQLPLELTPKQLELLNDVIENFRNDQGQLELPDPNTIPPAWINRLLPDPAQREQAKRMLEKYAKEHQLPLKPSPDSTRPDSSVANSPVAEAPAIGSPEAAAMPPLDQSGANSAPARQLSEAPVSARSSANDDLPAGIPPQYRDLFNRLKSFEQQQRQALEAEAPWQTESRAPSAAPNRSGNAPRQNNSRASGSSSPRANPLPRTSTNPPRTPRPNALSPRNGPPTESNATNRFNSDATGSPTPSESRNSRPPTGPTTGPTQATGPTGPTGVPSALDRQPPTGLGEGGYDPDNAPSRVELQDNSRSISDNSNSPAERAVEPAAATGAGQLRPLPDSENPFSPSFRPQNEQPPSAPLRLSPSSPSQSADAATTDSLPNSGRRFQVTELSQGGNLNRSDSNRLDVRRSLEQSGLAQSLKRIVEETIKEQEAKRNTATGSTNTSSTPTDIAALNKSLDDLLKSGTATNNRSAANSSTTTNNSSANAPNAAGSSPFPTPTWTPRHTDQSLRWARWASELWKSVSVVPERPSPNSRSSSDASSGLGLPEFRWTSAMTWVVVIVATLIAIIFWLGRKQIAELASPGKRQAEWVRSVLSEGLQNRADVIRVFHLLVRRGQAVSDWWTHRSVVRYFDQHKPQYAQAINELASVYEHARYYPDESDLSPQQLDQVRQIVAKLRAEI